jgi:hypothetical protein
MMTRSEQNASDTLPTPAEAPSRLQPHHSPGGRKAEYRQIKVAIAFRQNGQESYAVKRIHSATPTLTGHFPHHPTHNTDPNSPVAKVVASASGTASEVQLTVASRNYLHQLASSCTKLRNLHQKIFCQKNKIWRVRRLAMPTLTPPRSITSVVPPLQAPSSLTPFSQFSSCKVGRSVPASESRSIGADPLSSEPNLNTDPSPKVGRHRRGRRFLPLCASVVNPLPLFRPIQSYSDLFRLDFA